MADRKKLRTRLGADGFDYPYSSDLLIVDENGESVRAKIGNKKVVTPAHYELDNASGVFEVVADDNDPFDELTEVKVTDANVNNDGVPFNIGDKVNFVDEVVDTPASGIFKYVDDSIDAIPATDLTDYQKKEDDTLTTTDKTVVGAVNELDAEIGVKGVVGVPQHYELDNVGGTLTVVANGTLTNGDTEIEEKDVIGIASIGDKVNLIPEVSEVFATGLYKEIEDANVIFIRDDLGTDGISFN